MNMFSWLDAEVKRLDQEPKAQKIFDEAQKAIHEAVSETRPECLGQMHDADALTQEEGGRFGLRAQADAGDGRLFEPARSPSAECGRPQSQPLRQLGRKLR